MELVTFVNESLSFLTILADISIIYLIIFAVFMKRNALVMFVEKHALKSVFTITVFATIGSLFFSEVAKYVPCELCWFQRIFMYPLVIISLVGIFKKDENVLHYILPLSIIGALISIYHYIIQRLSVFGTCSIDGPSCSTSLIFNYGYITIPMMAFSAFLLTIVIIFIWKQNRSNKN